MPRYTTYSTGTVTATNGSRTVTGVNTAWMVVSTQEFQVVGGDLLRIGNQRPVVIDTVDSPTQVTLVEPWPHSTASASAYTIIRYATPPEARVLGALETLAQRGSSASPFERITFDSGGVRFQMRDDGSGLVGLYIGATGTADGSLTLLKTYNRTTLADVARGPLSWTGTTYMGLLIQSLTTAQRDALSSPGNGGSIYNSTVDRHQFRAGGAWREHVRRDGDAMTGPLSLPFIRVSASSLPRLHLTDASAATDKKIWQFYAASGNLTFSALDDAENAETSWLNVVRGAGTAITSVNFLNGNVGVGTASPNSRLTVRDDSAANTLPLRLIGQSNTIRTQNLGTSGILEAVNSSESAFQAMIVRGLTVSLSTGDAVPRVSVASSGLVGVNKSNPTTSLDVNGPIRHLTYTVATLPAAGTVGAGTRAAVTDANATTFNAVVAGGGANFVPVVSDGTNWRIG